MIWCCNLKREDCDRLFIPSFWRDVMCGWCLYHFSNDLKGDEIIWYNSRIICAGSPIVWKKPIDAGLMYVSQLLKEDGYILQEEATSNFSLSVMEYNTLKASIPKYIKANVLKNRVFVDQKFAKLMAAPKTASYLYKCLNADRKVDVRSRIKWENELGVQFPVEQLVSHIPRITTVMKQRSFQFRLIHRAVVTNVHLARWNVIQADLCTFCNLQPETYSHLFWECDQVKVVWRTVIDMLQELHVTDYELNKQSVMSNRVGKGRNNVANTIVLIVKQLIYRQRCLKQPISSILCRKEVMLNKSIEKYYAIKDGKISKFIKKWAPSMDLDNVTCLENLD